MCHHALSSASALTASKSASSLRLPRVGARTWARSTAVSESRPRSPGPAGGASAGTSRLSPGCSSALMRVSVSSRAGSHYPAFRVEAGSVLSVERRGEVALVTLQRPEKRNALSIELRERLAETFGDLSKDDRIACVVLTGAGSAFCSGMDTTQFGGDMENRRRLVETSTLAFDAVADCSCPVVAAVNGPALAGGFALALLCDLRVAGADAEFGYPELPRGIPPSYAAARAVLPATVAQELCLTGRILGASEAHRLGIVREVVPAGEIVERGLDLARKVAELPRTAVLETKRRTTLERRHLW